MIKSIKNSMNILNCFSSRTHEIGVTEISGKLHLSKSTTSRILTTLQQGNMVIKIPENQKYRLGSKFLELATNYLSNFDWRAIAIPHLRALRDKTDETISIFVLQGNQRICIEKIDSSQELRPVFNIGGHYPLHAGSAGKLLLAYLSSVNRKEILSKTGLPAFTSHTITTFEALEKEMNKIRKKGYAVSFQERTPFVASVTAPIKDLNGEVIGVLSLSAQLIRFTSEKTNIYIKLVKETANKISRELGYKPNKFEG